MKKIKQTIYVGIDVAKATLQVYCQERQREIGNLPTDHTKLCQELKALHTAHVICEATGGYERAVVEALQAAGILVSVVNPAQVRASAKAKGERAKTDCLDAKLLAEYGQRYHPEPTPPVSALQRQLCALTVWLEQLVEALAVAKAQAEQITETFVVKQHATLVKHYEMQIEKVEAQLETLLPKDSVLAQRIECLDEIIGVGRRTAWLIQAQIPELGTLNRQETAALAGLAPWTRESGAMKGRSCIGGGRPKVRHTLYMPTLTAVRHNPILCAFYNRLIAKNKLPKVALTAVMRKLLIYMNHKLKNLSATALSQKI